MAIFPKDERSWRALVLTNLGNLFPIQRIQNCDLFAVYQDPMCGRYQITSPVEAITDIVGDFQTLSYQTATGLPVRRSNDPDPMWPKIYNAAPTMTLPVIRAELHEKSGLTLEGMHWGLIPSWAKDRSFAAKAINARIETAHEKPSFRSAFEKRHALVPATAYFEWLTIHGQKQPFRFHLQNNKPLLLAGIWEEWQDKLNHISVRSFSLLTTESRGFKAISDIHHRMPIALGPKTARSWVHGELNLTPDTELDAEYQNAALLTHPISKAINKVANQSADLAKPIQLSESPSVLNTQASKPPKKMQGDLFQ